jgi:hypothetical protein
MNEEQPKPEQDEGYEAPKADDLDTGHGPAVTAAGDAQSPGEDVG